MWRQSLGKQIHFLRVWYRQIDGNFYGVLRAFQTGSFRSLVRLDTNTGEQNVICQLNSREEIYCTKSDRIITSNGEVIDLSNGRILRRLQFSQTDYPDKTESEVARK